VQKDSTCSHPHIPPIYTIFHIYLEPLLALSGAWHLHFAPVRYFTFMPSSSNYSAASQIAYDQLATCYVFFAAIEILVLRSTSDVKVWRAVVLALLICDAGHVGAIGAELGWKVWEWEGVDHVTMAMNVVPMVVRGMFLAGVGIYEA
jgi:hypothetical protein